MGSVKTVISEMNGMVQNTLFVLRIQFRAFRRNRITRKITRNWKLFYLESNVGNFLEGKGGIERKKSVAEFEEEKRSNATFGGGWKVD